MYTRILAASLLVISSPLIASAVEPTSRLRTLITNFAGIINILIGVASSLALLVFIWGLVKYIWSEGSAESKGEGKKIMIWGVVALFVLFSVFGLIRFLQDAFGVYNSDFNAPQIIYRR